MTFAAFSKFAGSLLTVSVLALTLAGCGSSNNPALTQGNWSMTATSSGAAGTFYIGGNLTQTGSSLAGSMQVNNACINPSQVFAFTGTINGKDIALTSASAAGQVITVTGTETSVSAMTGTYTVTGGCDDGDTGNIAAAAVPSISATWSGPIASQGGPNVTLALSLKQATTASSDGSFALTGTGAYTNSSCSSTATVTSAFIVGPTLVVNGTTDDGGNFFYTNVLLNNPASPTNMKGTYQVSGGNCDGDLDSPTFTKQ